MDLPVPACAVGFTEAEAEAEVLAVVGERRRDDFRLFIDLKAHPTCTGQPPCVEAHGSVWYPFDVQRFVERLLYSREGQ